MLKSASEDDDKGSYLPAKRDVYKEAGRAECHTVGRDTVPVSLCLSEVGITRQEVERYWKRRDESSKNFVDKFVGGLARWFCLNSCRFIGGNLTSTKLVL